MSYKSQEFFLNCHRHSHLLGAALAECNKLFEKNMRRKKHAKEEEKSSGKNTQIHFS